MKIEIHVQHLENHSDKKERGLKNVHCKLLWSTTNFFVWFECLLNVLTKLSCGRVPKLTSGTETEQGDHDFCLRRSQYTETDPNGRERSATEGIKPSTS